MPDRSKAIGVFVIALLVCLLAAGVLVACSSSPTAEVASPTDVTVAESPLPAPTLEPPTPEMPLPEPGTAAIVGQLFTYTGHGPIPGTVCFLTLAEGGDEPSPPTMFTGPDEAVGDVSGTSDEGGWVSLNNIPPGNYYLAVWAPYEWIIAEESDVDRIPRLITLEAGQQLNLGRIYVAWP